jgi:SAM-dependent methyltransferase
VSAVPDELMDDREILAEFRMTEPSTQVSFTGSIPRNYDTYLGPFLFEFSGADMAQRITAAVGGAARVLEVACGTGISTRHLANTLPAGSEILATDLNDAMLAHAATVNGALPGVTYQQADALDLAFEDGTFDAVVCQFGIMFFPDKAAGMREMTRVLKPGGVLALNVWESLDRNPAARIADSVIKSFFETDPPRFLETPFGFHDVDAGRGLFIDTGYEVVEITHVAGSIETDDLSLPARGFVTGNPTIIEVEQRATVGADALIAAITESLARELGQAPVTLEFREIVYLAHKPRG